MSYQIGTGRVTLFTHEGGITHCNGTLDSLYVARLAAADILTLNGRVSRAILYDAQARVELETMDADQANEIRHQAQAARIAAVRSAR